MVLSLNITKYINALNRVCVCIGQPDQQQKITNYLQLKKRNEKNCVFIFYALYGPIVLSLPQIIEYGYRKMYLLSNIYDLFPILLSAKYKNMGYYIYKAGRYVYSFIY